MVRRQKVNKMNTKILITMVLCLSMTGIAVADDPCENITCGTRCIGYDLYNEDCKDSIFGPRCGPTTLLERNSAVCGYVSCEEGTCTATIYVDGDLYNMTCVDGTCVPYMIIEENYDPCENVSCNGTICMGNDLYNLTCIDGICTPYMVIEENCTDCDPCNNVTCNNTCFGVNMYNMTCLDGECVQYMLIQSNCPDCGYVTPSSRRSSGGGGTYPPVSTNNTTIDDPKSEIEPTPESTPKPTEKASTQPSITSTVTDANEATPMSTITVDEDDNILPGFGVIMTILGLISVAYIVNRRRD